jgi:flagellar assembly protein FliH
MTSSFDPLSIVKQREFAPLTCPETDRGARENPGPFPDFGVKSGSGPEAAADPAHDEALRKQRDAAYAAGVAAGREAVQREVVARATDLGTAIEEVARFRSTLLERYQHQLLDLALEVARRVVQHELAEHPEHWLAMIREAVGKALDRETVQIRVGSVLHRFLLERLPKLRALLDDVKDLEVVEDTCLAETACLIETSYGDLDLSVDSQLGAMRVALTEAA